ncbi:MAG: hypothetical protein KJ000_23325 [Pirellulaceae bacterium]|nr:hypothetical protein [Pirellulaceae bacterium]
MLTRKEWKTHRDKNKVSSGAVKDVGVGPLLDEYEKAGNDYKKRLQVLLKMEKAFKTYHDALQKSKDENEKKFAPVFKKLLLNPVIEEVPNMRKFADAPQSLKGSLESVMSQGSTLLKGEVSAKGYMEFFLSEQVRLVHMRGVLLSQSEKGLSNALKLWDQAYATVNPAKLADDPATRAQAVKALVAAAKTFDQAAKKLKLY